MMFGYGSTTLSIKEVLMFNRTLVTYASRYGSTQEIAERIAKTLERQGIATTIQAAQDVRSIASYEAVVIGSAVYGGVWLPEAKDFIERFQKELAGKEIWVFSSGPATHDDPVKVLGGWHSPENLEETLAIIRPQATALFSGKIDATKLSAQDYLVSSSLRGTSGDYRNWSAIEGWAEEIAFALTRLVAGGT
jgi:menaquinone-dependent protoporphyrinogen oxidase